MGRFLFFLVAIFVGVAAFTWAYNDPNGATTVFSLGVFMVFAAIVVIGLLIFFRSENKSRREHEERMERQRTAAMLAQQSRSQLPAPTVIVVGQGHQFPEVIQGKIEG